MCWVFPNEHFLSKKKCEENTCFMHIGVHIYPHYVPAHNTPRSKKVKNGGRHRNFLQPRGPIFFPSGEGDVGSFGPLLWPMCSHQVLNVFLLSSQCVPQHVLNSTSLCLICFVQCCPILGLISFVWLEWIFLYWGSLQTFRISLGFSNQRGPLAKRNLNFGVPTTN
jgi:hypothetical protein